MTDATPEPRPLLRFVGLMLMAISLLWIAGSGLCSLAFLVPVLWDSAMSPADKSDWSGLALLIGGGSMLIGLLVYWLGRRLRPRNHEVK